MRNAKRGKYWQLCKVKVWKICIVTQQSFIPTHGRGDNNNWCARSGKTTRRPIFSPVTGFFYSRETEKSMTHTKILLFELHLHWQYVHRQTHVHSLVCVGRTLYFNILSVSLDTSTGSWTAFSICYEEWCRHTPEIRESKTVPQNLTHGGTGGGGGGGVGGGLGVEHSPSQRLHGKLSLNIKY